jgi:HK97 family phage prohead protease
MSKRETRTYSASAVRAMGGSGGSDPLRIEGYAAVFNSYSRDLGGFREMIMPGAFTRTIADKQDVKCLLNHNPDCVLGRTKSGTLILNQDSVGLAFRCELPDTQIARDLHTSIKRGDISQCSFAFSVNPGGESWSEDEDDEEEDSFFVSRKLSDLNTFDVSAVCYPAYDDTSVASRELSELVPVEVRSAVAAKNAAKRHVAPPTKPPAVIAPVVSEPVTPTAEQLSNRARVRQLLDL